MLIVINKTGSSLTLIVCVKYMCKYSMYRYGYPCVVYQLFARYTYVCSKYLAISIFLCIMCSYFTDIIVTVVSHYSATEVSKCFI